MSEILPGTVGATPRGCPAFSGIAAHQCRSFDLRESEPQWAAAVPTIKGGQERGPAPTNRIRCSELSYWLALTGVSTGPIYYVTILLQQPKETASFLQLLMFGLSFVFYLPVNWLPRKMGKKNLVLLAAVPLAIFGILPNAMIADIAEADGIRTGNFKAAIFFGARTFMSKMGQMFTGIVFPSLLILGMEPVHAFGVRLTAIVAMAFSALGGLLLLPYKEKEILQTLQGERSSGAQSWEKW